MTSGHPVTVPAIRPARRADLADIEALLEKAALGAAELAPHVANFFVAELDGKIIGAIGLEIYGDVGLLRSAAVAPEYRSQGLGRRCVETIVAHAIRRGITQLVLLTTTAEAFFASQGFIRVGREQIRGEILSSSQFRYACPESAAVMVRKIP